MATKKILIIEDERKIARILSLELNHEGYQTDVAENGMIGLEKVLSSKWDLILLDVMLPEISGIEVLRRMRKKDTSTPVILLTAKDTVPDKVNGLDHGANDYITKPFDIEELFARVRACFRMTDRNKTFEQSDVLSIEDLTVNPDTREVTRYGTLIELTPKEFDLLVFLLENKNHVLSREQIIKQVWGHDYLGVTNAVDVYIRYLREKVDKTSDKKLIQTYRGVGYSIKE
ncbi:response regulator transcription factor [Fictibacillus barbaricus]|uniref:DNA-binding response OmpR family regulator n=1 Tax=Fictibacillus barbaricus TaxID=182136 RepID=A0ABU1U255_9BACL|nr:response regulator transcription factor [Fictibacillus barbaricus]MDR7073570.1 DNA-binding response OmpR family regulator [Fictibacillus barbaricus]